MSEREKHNCKKTQSSKRLHLQFAVLSYQIMFLLMNPTSVLPYTVHMSPPLTGHLGFAEEESSFLSRNRQCTPNPPVPHDMAGPTTFLQKVLQIIIDFEESHLIIRFSVRSALRSGQTCGKMTRTRRRRTLSGSPSLQASLRQSIVHSLILRSQRQGRMRCWPRL